MSSAVLRTLAVRISANSAAFRKDIGKVDKQFKRLSRGMRREAMMFQGQMASLGATVATGFGVAEVARAADEMVNLRNKMGATFGTTREVANGMLSIKKIARESRSELDAVGTLYQRIAVSTKSLGTEQKDVAKVTQVVANSFLMSGTTASEAANSARQFAQGLASGTLRGDEFRSVSENNVVLTRLLADGLNMTVGQLRLFSQTGGLTAETMMPILIAALEDTNAEVAKMSLTLGQAKTLFRNAFVEMVDRLNQTYAVVPKVAQAIGTLAENIHIVVGVAGALATILIGRLLVGLTAYTVMTVVGAVSATKLLIVNMARMTAIIAGHVIANVIGLTAGLARLAGTGLAMAIAGFARLTAMMLLNPIGIAVTAVSALVGGIIYLSTKFDLLEKFGQLMEGVGLIGKGIGETIVNGFKKIPIQIKLMGRTVVRSVAYIMDKLKMTSLAEKLRNSVGNDDADLISQIAGLNNAPGASFAAGKGMIAKAMDFRGEDGVYNSGQDIVSDIGSDAAAVMDKAGSFLSTLIPDMDFQSFMDAAPAKFQEFIASTSASMAEATPGFAKFWAALTGADPDQANAGEAPAKEDEAYSWAERWSLAIEEVKKSWSGLAQTVAGKVAAMRQQYATYDQVLTAGAQKSKKIAAIQRALMIKEAIIAGKNAIVKAWGAAPFPANLPGVVLTTAQTGLTIRDMMSGQAHDGMDSLPNTGTYMLEKGERVVSSRVNRDLTDFLGNGRGGMGQDQPISFTINGVSDPDLVFQALEQRTGELTEMIRGISAEQATAAPF